MVEVLLQTEAIKCLPFLHLVPHLMYPVMEIWSHKSSPVEYVESRIIFNFTFRLNTNNSLAVSVSDLKDESHFMCEMLNAIV